MTFKNRDCKASPRIEARSAISPDSFASDMFDVSFTTLPGASDAVLDRLQYLICDTVLPGSVSSLTFDDAPKAKEWYINVMLDDLVDYETFVDWHDNQSDVLGEAILKIYNLRGDLRRTYKLKGLKIQYVPQVDLHWEQYDGDVVRFGVDFLITGGVERS